MNKIMMVTGSIVAWLYITEFFYAWYSQVEFEQYASSTDWSLLQVMRP
jgi:molybdopterin-containing oxidoreductase family membrane subunit